MRAIIDGTFEFEQVGLEVQSLKRSEMERSSPGLNGVVSIDLGGRQRQIVQKGILRSSSSKTLDGNIELLSSFIDGKDHSLAVDGDEVFGDLRMDKLEVDDKVHSGRDVSCQFTVTYTQLRV
jgi:DNA polymerase II large subunit